jgi:hypothetical protein
MPPEDLIDSGGGAHGDEQNPMAIGGVSSQTGT